MLLKGGAVPAVLLQGCTLAIALCADRPEYNDKFSVIVHMGPVCTHMTTGHSYVCAQHLQKPAMHACTLCCVYWDSRLLAVVT
jgi:hypothetical protein